jgi:aldose 1-epimerase
MIPLTGSQYEIAAGEYTAVVTELGAGLRELRRDGNPVIAGYPPDELPPGAAGQLLLPWPNRVDQGRYTLEGRRYQLDLTEPGAGNAIHGLTRCMSWQAAHHEQSAVVLRLALLGQPGYPFCLETEVEYRLSEEGGLGVRVCAENTGSRPAPYGTGSHPYLTAGSASVDDCELTLPASQWLPADDRGIPAGPAQAVAGSRLDFLAARKIADIQLDHAFTGLCRDASGRAWARLRCATTEVALWAGTGYNWLQVFTGDTLDSGRCRSVAVEPMTCPPNAFVSGTDVLLLKPGDQVTHHWGIEVTVS